MNMRNKVQALQSKLSCAAKQSSGRGFGALYDKIYREDVLWMAWQRVRANKGAPGIDQQSIEYIEEEIGVEAFLGGYARSCIGSGIVPCRCAAAGLTNLENRTSAPWGFRS